MIFSELFICWRGRASRGAFPGRAGERESTGTGMVIFSLSGASRPKHNIISLVPAYYNNKYNFVRVDINTMGQIILNHSNDFAAIPSLISWLQLNFAFSVAAV